jgi:hypothetical protein
VTVRTGGPGLTTGAARRLRGRCSSTPGPVHRSGRARGWRTPSRVPAASPAKPTLSR